MSTQSIGAKQFDTNPQSQTTVLRLFLQAIAKAEEKPQREIQLKRETKDEINLMFRVKTLRMVMLVVVLPPGNPGAAITLAVISFPGRC